MGADVFFTHHCGLYQTTPVYTESSIEHYKTLYNTEMQLATIGLMSSNCGILIT